MYSKIHPIKLGLSAGIIWGVSLFVMTIICIHTGYAQDLLNALVNLYPGYSLTYIGAVVGMVIGFADAGILFFLIAWLYNKFNP